MTWHVHPTRPVVYTNVQLPPEATEGAEIARNNKAVVLRHDQLAYELLRARGVLLPPPVKRYGYPGRFPPMQHQIETTEFLVDNPVAACLDPIGSGKTNAALWAMDYLMSQGVVKRVLIVCPMYIRDTVWKNEFLLSMPGYNVALVSGDRRRKLKIAADKRLDVLIVNPHSLHIIQEAVKDVDLILVDEATDFKTATRRRWKSLNTIAKGKRLWLVTGTPRPQAPTDAYGIYKLLLRDAKPISFGSFRDLTMRKITPFRWDERLEANDVIARLLKPAIRHSPEECTDLPEVSYINLDVPLSKEQDKLITDFKRLACVELEGDTITAGTAAALASKTLQVMAGGVYNADREARQVDAAPLYTALEGIVREAGCPVLVFAAFRNSIPPAVQHLTSAGYRVAEIHGGISTADRASTFSAFQAGDLDVIVAVASAMSHGLTLTRSRVVVWVTPPPASIYLQANGRVYRQGQTGNVVVYHLVQHPLAKRLYDRLHSKTAAQTKLLDLIKQELLYGL